MVSALNLSSSATSWCIFSSVHWAHIYVLVWILFMADHGTNTFKLVHCRWWWLPLLRIITFSHKFWCTEWIRRFFHIVACPWHPSTSHVTSQAALGKYMVHGGCCVWGILPEDSVASFVLSLSVGCQRYYQHIWRAFRSLYTPPLAYKLSFKLSCNTLRVVSIQVLSKYMIGLS